MRTNRTTDSRSTVPYELAKNRALQALTQSPIPASSVADAIWPGHQMNGQGAGGAASRILKRMQDEGLARWTSNKYRWGWVRT